MLEIKNIKVELDAEHGLVRAIDGMRLTLQRGETFALVGESGCGKSMTALALMRLLPENGYIASGDVLVDQEDVLALPESQMRAVRGGRIGMIFQEPSTSLNPVMKIGDQIVEAIEAHTPLRGEAARAKALDWLRKVGIPEPERRIDDYPFRMSGGQKQRVMIAMTLAGEPDYIIADEPTTALDVTIQAQVLDLLKQLQAEHGLGLLLITHDLAVVSGMAHRVALMYAGQIIEVATAEEFFSSPKHPYAKALLRALPDSTRRGQSLAAIPGTVPPLTTQFQGCRFEPRCYCAEPACKTTLPELYTLAGTRSVRCLRYAPGHDAQATEAIINIVPAAAPIHAAKAAAAGTQPLLQVDQLRVRFPIRKGLLQRVHGYFDAVDGISFKVQPGQTLALVGESGCGKTTTGKAIVQLLRHQATFEGQALLNGQNLFEMEGEPLQKARRDIQIIFQDPFASLNPRMRVFDILEEGLLSLQPDLDAGARRERLQRLADQVGLRQDALDRYPHEFSGGQRQRIAIARALAVQPKLIVCDEPTSALDVSVQAQILNLLRDLQRELGVSYLFITHNIGVVEYIADEVAVMRAGRIVEQGTCDAVISHPRDAYTKKLIASVPRLATVGA
ncbi:ABC transporter ATP-binding protein [Ideonella sp.]|uniref:ABC transporter ATP-binding protein n=1 Tax=Ideonella sp. TaxID=1929293 RepID=UPI0035B14EC4